MRRIQKLKPPWPRLVQPPWSGPVQAFLEMFAKVPVAMKSHRIFVPHGPLGRLAAILNAAQAVVYHLGPQSRDLIRPDGYVDLRSVHKRTLYSKVARGGRA